MFYSKYRLWLEFTGFKWQLQDRTGFYQNQWNENRFPSAQRKSWQNQTLFLKDPSEIFRDLWESKCILSEKFKVLLDLLMKIRSALFYWFLCSELTVHVSPLGPEDECLCGGRVGPSRTSRIRLSVCEQWLVQRWSSRLQYWTWTIRHKVSRVSVMMMFVLRVSTRSVSQ